MIYGCEEKASNLHEQCFNFHKKYKEISTGKSFVKMLKSWLDLNNL